MPSCAHPAARGGARRLVVVLVVTAVVWLTAAAVPAGATPSSRAPTSLGLSLLGQSTWVASNEVWSLRLGVTGSVPSTDRIEVTVYPQLTTRSGFDQAADGAPIQDFPVWIGQEAVGGAPLAAPGGVWARIPVNDQASPPGDLTTGSPFDPGNQSGVYPVRIQLFTDNYAAVGNVISTFLVYSAGQSSFSKLVTSVTVPIGAPTTLSSRLVPSPLGSAASAQLSRTASILASHPGVTVSLAVAPLTAEALESGSATDRVTLTRLAGAVHRGDELLPQPYVPVSLAALEASGLGDQIPRQLQEGDAVLASTLGAEPDMGTWVLAEATDDPTLQVLRGEGLRHLIVPETTLSPLPAALVTTTYGRPTALDDGVDAALAVIGTDPVLTRRITQPTTPVVAAEQTLAELAMIELEAPSVSRGVAISLPASLPVAPAYLETLLAGLAGNPFVQTVTAAGLFARVPATPPAGTDSGGGAGGSATGAAVPVQTLRTTAVASIPDAVALQSLDADIGGVSGFLPGDAPLAARLRRQLLFAVAPGIGPARRARLLAAMRHALSVAESSVRLPGDTSVTLTSLDATVPLVVLSDARLTPHVRLVLQSPKLDFRAFRPPYGGTCQVKAGNTEVCSMVLHGPQTILKVPVEARTSGVFSLDVLITSPDGSLTMADARDTVRSTAISSVGIVIIVVSLLFLGIWWIRDIRSGRRARQLVRRPGDDIGDGDDGPPSGGVGPPPPSRPVGPSQPVVPQLTPRPPVTVGDRAVPVGAAPRADRTHLEARRRGPPRPDRPHPRPGARAQPRGSGRGDAQRGHGEMSPSGRPVGPTVRAATDPPEERAP